MELIRISDHKLKIMLTPTDMRHFELNAATFGDDRVQMHRAFRLLLEEVKRRTDFDADDNRISVQYFPSREGGCEMFISHLPPLLPSDTEGKCQEKASGRASSSLALHPKNAYVREYAYCFPSLEELLAVCQRLLMLGFAGESKAYRSDTGSCYLFLSVCTASPFSIPEELAFVVEYGTIESAGIQKMHLCEHGTVICHERAVQQLGSLA